MIFVDTSAWLALADSHDRDHSEAVEFQHRIGRGDFGKQATTNYVLAEAVTVIRRRLGLGPAVAFSDGISQGTGVELFWVERVHHRDAIDLMTSHKDKRWSVTDCASFVIMHSIGIDDAFAFDDDFRQAGFVVHP
ncbi:MAG TPA: PIN domain-containing protein [Thermoplasmata archaeon]|nr:PIN domain-containing protein [Thermoplasmata archaeon]